MPRGKANRFAAFMNSPKVTAALLLLVMLACGIGAVFARGAATALRDHGLVTTGEVLEVHDERRDNYVVVRFEDDHGREVTADVGNYRWSPRPQVGDRPQLVYDPDNPSGSVADTRNGPDFFSVWALAIGALLAGALIGPTWTGRLDWNKLR
jgi:hypothetical protein